MAHLRLGLVIGWLVRGLVAAAGGIGAAACVCVGDAASAQHEPAVADRAPERSSPFEAVRWTDSGEPEVMVEGTWFAPISIEGVAVSDVTARCRERYGARARKRFEEDLVVVMREMGHELPARVTLVVRGLAGGGGGGEERTLAGVAMSEANRRRIWEAAAARERGGGDREKAAPDRVPARLSAADARAVVDRLEGLLRTRHSYTAAFGHDPVALLASVRRQIKASADEGLDAGRFVELLEVALAPIGDGHAQVEARGLARPAYFMPAAFVPVEVEGRMQVAALEPNARRLLDPNNPFVLKIDEAFMDQWEGAAGAGVAKGSPQLVRRRALRTMADVARMRSRLGLLFARDDDRVVRFTLIGGEGESRIIERAVAERQAAPPAYATAPRDLPPGITYVRIARMYDDGEEARAILAACIGAEANGLILDVRGNGGGDRMLIREIGRLILPADASAVVFNAARPLRLPEETGEELRDRMDTRYLRAADDSRWTEAERGAVARFAAGFKPERELDDSRFHPWHYAVLAPAPADSPRVRGRVVVLMDAGCFSATDIFLCAMKELPRVTLVGTASGGGSGLAHRHELGHGFSVRLSTMVSFQPDGRLLDGNGVTPDEVVVPGVADFTSERDTMLERAIEILRAPEGR